MQFVTYDVHFAAGNEDAIIRVLDFARQPIQIVSEDELRDLLRQPGSGWVVLGADWADKPDLSARLAASGARIVDRSTRLILVKLR